MCRSAVWKRPSEDEKAPLQVYPESGTAGQRESFEVRMQLAMEIGADPEKNNGFDC